MKIKSGTETFIDKHWH